MTKPFIVAADKNKEPILAVLRRHFAHAARVLEIGAGTGQHAVYFAERLAHLTWLPSDLPELLPGIVAWVEDSRLDNVLPPIALDVRKQPWPSIEVDAVYSANTAHFMAWDAVVCMLAGIGALLPAGGVFAWYGPFNYGGRFTSDGNRRLDTWLKAQDPALGLRDFEVVDQAARERGLALVEDCRLPVHNRMLIFARA